MIHAVAAAHEFLSPDPASGRPPCLQYVIEGDGVRFKAKAGPAGSTLECLLVPLARHPHFQRTVFFSFFVIEKASSRLIAARRGERDAFDFAYLTMMRFSPLDRNSVLPSA